MTWHQLSGRESKKNSKWGGRLPVLLRKNGIVGAGNWGGDITKKKMCETSCLDHHKGERDTTEIGQNGEAEQLNALSARRERTRLGKKTRNANQINGGGMQRKGKSKKREEYSKGTACRTADQWECIHTKG